MYGYIYMTENLINGKKYIGQKKSSKFLHERYLGSGTLLKKAITKYGRENFVVHLIVECATKEELDEMEIYYIQKYDAQNNENFYNIARGGESGVGGAKFTGHHHTEEAKKNISDKVKGEKNPFYGKTHDEQTKIKMREKARMRKPVSEETRKKLSAIHKGVKFSDEHRRKISEAQKGSKGNNYGKNLSDETKSKISKTVSNQVWMNDGVRSYRINKDDVETYIAKGYVLGRLSFKKSPTAIES